MLVYLLYLSAKKMTYNPAKFTLHTIQYILIK
jgi:hypothetical protein